MHKRVVNIVMLVLFKYADTRGMTGHVLGGDHIKINNYPHAVFLDIRSADSCICGGSILNQVLVLTAAHCFDDYLGRKKDTMYVRYGSSNISEMTNIRMLYYRLHDEYSERTFYSDVAIIRSKVPFKFGVTAQRVAIMVHPPLGDKMAFVSGWGAINNRQDLPKILKHTNQKLQPAKICNKYLLLPPGTFCAGPIHGKGHPAKGDSGGALVVKQFIQIGIVSFKEDKTSLVVYTNVSYYYDWINRNAVNTYCALYQHVKS